MVINISVVLWYGVVLTAFFYTYQYLVRGYVQCSGMIWFQVSLLLLPQ